MIKTLLLLLLCSSVTEGFVVPQAIRPGRALTTLQANKVTAEDNTKYCIPLQNVCLDDLPKVGG